ncbi:hypothetical protein TIFTF001_011521 [Ficus carica]|uniref:Bulb-type lectin domain-containing protein n=1 Tax=Ficus carica TaxID=3494 RepID=A0AA88AAM0_FICCA|nr:hypothetical protein TIFTF001_011521 [Ficus carica]
MSDTGNFILYNDVFDVVWESFEHPTDTILGGQILAAGAQLFASVSETNSSTGRFHLEMQEDGNLVLYLTNAENLPRDAYWATNTEFPNPAVWKIPDDASMLRHLRLNFSGILSIVDSFDRVLWSYDSFLSNTHTNKSMSTITTIYQATLDADGVFRLYSHIYGDQNGSVVLVWSALKNVCRVKGYCGLNSYCILDDNKQPSCVCQPGTEFADMNHKTFGCLRNYSIVGCTSNGKEVNITDYSLSKMDDLSFADFY